MSLRLQILLSQVSIAIERYEAGGGSRVKVVFGLDEAALLQTQSEEQVMSPAGEIISPERCQQIANAWNNDVFSMAMSSSSSLSSSRTAGAWAMAIIRSFAPSV